MINGATVTLAGYVATEPSYRTINDRTPVVSMRVAWSSRYLDRETGEWRDGKTSYANVNCWRKLAGNVAPSLRKGEAVVLTGRLQVRDFDDREGRRRVAVDIDADAIGHDLSRGVAHFQRTLRGAAEAAADGQPDGLASGTGLAGEAADTDVGHAPELAGQAAAADAAQGLAGRMTDGEQVPDLAGPDEAGPGDGLDQEAVSRLARAEGDAVAAAAPF